MPTSEEVNEAATNFIADTNTANSKINGAAGLVTDRHGTQTKNLQRLLSEIGYAAPVAFQSGLTPDDATFTVEYGGEIYGARPSEIPFTTTGSFDPDQWIMRLSAIPQILINGAAGDGTTDDKSYIDTLNVAGTTVDLGGKDYAYTGTFTQSANFINGRIISSTQGTYDFLYDTIITDLTVTVGAAGTFKRLDAAFDWLKSKKIIGFITLSILDMADDTDEDDPLALDHYLFDHPDSSHVLLVGQAMSGAVPVASDMTGTKATDLAFCEGRYNSSIYLPGDGISGSYGLAVPNGLNQIKDILFISDNRYSLDIGFVGAHESSRNVSGGGTLFTRFSIIGGVWGIIAKDTHLAFSGGAFFGYQISGAPVDLLKCTLIASTNKFTAYNFTGAQTADGPKYGLFCDQATICEFASEVLVISGTFLHGVFADNGSRVSAPDAIIDGATQALSFTNGSEWKGNGLAISNAVPSNTSLVPGASQGGFGNNIYQSGIIVAGAGAIVNASGVTMDACEAAYGAVASAGTLLLGLAAMAVDDCKFTSAFCICEVSSNANCIVAAITNPRSGSSDQILARACSVVYVTGSSGLTYSPTINTVSNGNLITNSYT